MRSAFEIAGCLISIGTLVFAATLYVNHRDLQGPPPISSERALQLLNTCENFTHTKVGTRQATAATRMLPVRASRGRLNIVSIRWRWTSGASAPDLPELHARALIEWQSNGRFLGDYRFTPDHWRRATIFYGNNTIRCDFPVATR